MCTTHVDKKGNVSKAGLGLGQLQQIAVEWRAYTIRHLQSQFWRLEFWDQGVGKVGSSEGHEEKWVPGLSFDL